MLKTHEGKEIIILTLNGGKGAIEDEKLLIKKGLRPMTTDEFASYSKETHAAIYKAGAYPFYGKTPDGSFWRGYYFSYDDGRVIYVGERLDDCGGVVGVRDKPHKHKFKPQPKKCDCGEEM